MNTEMNVVYVVNRVHISASEYNQNGYTQTYLYKDINRAKRNLKALRAADISELERLDNDYEIYTDTDEKFHVAWDSDLEMIFITLNKQIIDKEV